MFRLASHGSAGILCAALLTATVPAGAVTVTINPGQTYQTMEGIGAFISMPFVLREAGRFWDQRPDDYDILRIVQEFGATVMRFELSPDAYPVEGGGYNWSAQVFGAGGVDNQIRLMREMIKLGCDRFIFSVWSPPCWMKESGMCIGPREASLAGGNMNNFLKVSQYDAFAQFVVDYMKMVKDSTGVEPYAISPQNEPYFHQPYYSCVYSGDGLSTITTKIGEKLQAAGLSTRLFGAEHMLWDGTNVYRALVSNQHLHAFAVHGYTDGVTADHGNADTWSNLKNAVQGKELWMTETTTPGGLVQAGRGLHQAFQSGRVSLWTWWAYSAELGSYTQTDGINTAWRPNNAYWATSHYARFIRPGAVSVGATASSGSVWSTAFKNPDNTWAVVLVNTGGAATVSVSGAGLPGTWQVYESNVSDRRVHKGSSGSSGIALPGNGMVTLYSGDPIPALPADTTANSVTAPNPTNIIGELTLFADDFFDGVYLNGQPINIETRGSVRVNLLKGENVLAAKQVNTAWGGGMLASMLLPGNDTLRTDGTWKMTIKEPGEGWMNLNYADATWTAASEFGPVEVWPSFERWGLDAVNLYYQKARWISGATNMYFRKEMDFPYNYLMIVGNNFRYKLYIDGELKSQDEFVCGSACQFGDNKKAVRVDGISPGRRTFALEVEDASLDGNGVLIKMYWRDQTNIIQVLDPTWKCWHTEAAGWKSAGFDDSEWINPQPVEAHCEYANQLPFIYPTDFWYRKVFTSSEGTSGIIRINRIPRPDGALPAPQHFNLRGQRLDVTTPAAAAAGGIILQRTTDGAGQTRIKKGVTVTR